LAIHDRLKLLAGQCDGARTLDGHGFTNSTPTLAAPSPKPATSLQTSRRRPKTHPQIPAPLPAHLCAPHHPFV
jgi:hypothetical protein